MPTAESLSDVLFGAIETKNLVDLQRAISAGATAGMALNGGKTALMETCSSGWYDGFKALRATATKDVINRSDQNAGSTALMYAAARSTPSVVRWLVLAGADIEAQDDEGYTALMTAILSPSGKNLVALCRMGTDVSKQDKDGRTALTMAVDGNLQADVCDLIRFGADVNQTGRGGKSPLMYAARKGTPTLLDVLLRSGAHLHHLDAAKNSVLMHAAVDGNEDSVRHLLNLGVDPALQNKGGKKAEDITWSGTCRAILRAVREREVLEAVGQEDPHTPDTAGSGKPRVL